MHFIYLSPHFDDAVYSCGGLISRQTRAGEQVSIWTICGGDAPAELSPYARQLHADWGTGSDTAQQRREEDHQTAAWVGAEQRVFSVPDVIYRFTPQGTPVVSDNQGLFAPLPQAEYPLAASLAEQFERLLKEAQKGGTEVQLICPLTVGGHVDHQLTRKAAEMTGSPLWFYADFPYIRREPDFIPPAALTAGLTPMATLLSKEDTALWQAGIQAYASQFSSFWDTPAVLHAELEQYLALYQGLPLWKNL